MRGWNRAFIRAIFFRRLQEAVGVLLLLTLILWAGYVTGRHWVLRARLPAVTWHPVQLKTPLSEADLWGDAVRWVEVDATPAPPAGEKETRYRDTLESPGSLILHFPSASNIKGRATYRGLLQAYPTRRSPERIPKALRGALRDAGLVPAQKFTVLSVEASPWPLWAPRIKEGAVLASGLCLILFLLWYGVRVGRALVRPIVRGQWVEVAGDPTGAWPNRCARCGLSMESSVSVGTDAPGHADLPCCPSCRRPAGRWASRLRRAAVVVATMALAWMLYRSLRYRPVIPAESIMALGASALVGLVAAVRRGRPRPLYPLWVCRHYGSERHIKSERVHEAFLTAVMERSHSPLKTPSAFNNQLGANSVGGFG